MVLSRPTINEVDFCGQVASEANVLIRQNPAAFAPFHEARIEGYGTGAGSRKRKDLRFRDPRGKLELCGEVKLPGKPESSSPYNDELRKDAEEKANGEGLRFFFTWNVNTFVLWDRSRYDVPPLDRRVQEWRLARILGDARDVAREDNLRFIKTHFLPDLLRDLADIVSGRRRDWSMPPDDVFIRSLNSHLDWPFQLASAYILANANRDKDFDARVQRWMADQGFFVLRKQPDEWAKLVDNMAKTLAYVWANRLIFYKALRSRFPDLPRLELRASVKKPEEAVAAFNCLFQRAAKRSGDYEPLLMPDAKDWAANLVFHPPGAMDAWRGLLRGIESVNFREVPSDVVGKIFQKLIGPEERHQYGQHFTGDDPVDLINVFCVRNATDAMFDPACGSASFLVRAYYRKRHLDPTRPHLDLIGKLFGCDIAPYPAHLATLNLAAREINEEANYPRIAHMNFFDFAMGQPFCKIPDANNPTEKVPVLLPPLDAVVGNPPYVRQEKVPKEDKARFGQIAATAWPGLRLTGRSDLHCYFWPAATRLLKPDGYFGFLTSSSWLDVEYGFALQGWILRHFRILAVMESAAEPWFEDARVKTCITILQRCDDEAERMANRVRFVRFNRKLEKIIGIPATQERDEARQLAMELLRERILSAQADRQDDDMRIVVKTQRELWEDGVRAGTILGNSEPTDSQEADEEDESAGEQDESSEAEALNRIRNGIHDAYRAGKWGRYVRAPDLYFDIMWRFGSRFVALGQVAAIRRGITSGCDDFFMPWDITARVLATHKSDMAFRKHAGAPRKDAESGKLRIIEDGNGVVHPIEAEYLAPEVHSLMNMNRAVVRAADLDRVVLLVGEPMDKLKDKAPWVWRYLRYGMTPTFSSAKSGSATLPKRSTCAARDPWYDLTALAKPAFAFWPKGQQYRHMVIANPDGFPCNCRLYEMQAAADYDPLAFVAILNSTLVALWRNFYGRYTGTEGAMETMVIDARLIDVPSPIGASPTVCRRLKGAFERLSLRDSGDLVEEQLMECHKPARVQRIAAGPLVLPQELQQPDRRDLDDAVLELMGVSDPNERETLIARLYEATAQHYRDIRVVEIEKMEQRTKTGDRRFSTQDLAADIWDGAELEDATPLPEWIGRQPESDSAVIIPDERPAVVANPLFDPNKVYCGKGRKTYIDCTSQGQAQLVARLANLGVSGDVKLPAKQGPCSALLVRLEERMVKALGRFKELAESRTEDAKARGQIMEAVERWFVLGRQPAKPNTPSEVDMESDEAAAGGD